MWFLQARCGLLFTIINHNHNQTIIYPSMNPSDCRSIPWAFMLVFLTQIKKTLHAIGGTTASPSSYRFIGTLRVKMFPLVWLHCKASRRWTDQGLIYSHTVRRLAEDVDNDAQGSPGAPLRTVSLRLHTMEKVGNSAVDQMPNHQTSTIYLPLWVAQLRGWSL